MEERMTSAQDALAMPQIDAPMRVRWRSMLSTLAETMGNCAGRIWSLSGAEAEVLVAHGSPLPGEGMRVAVKGSKLIYQDVARERSTLDVASPQWPASAEAHQGIKDYLGMPIKWPGGAMFGVIEILSSDPRPFTSLHRRLAAQVRDNIEDHLGAIAALAEKSRLTAERDLQREVASLASDTADFGAWDYDISGDQLNGDDGWYRLLGLYGGEPVTSLAGFKRFIHVDDRIRVSDASLLGLTGPSDGNQDSSISFRIVRPDGAVRWIHSSSRVMDNLPRRTVGIIVDITDSHITEDALRQGHGALIEADAALKDIRERLSLAAQATGTGIWELNGETGALACDANLNAILGVDAGDVVEPTALLRRVHVQDRNQLDFKRMAKRTQQPLNQDLQFRVVRPTGEIRWVICAPHMSEATATLPRRLRGFVTDITEAHNAREELERNRVALEHTEKLVQLANWRFDVASQQFHASDLLNQMNDSDSAASPLTQADMEQLLSPKSHDGATSAIQHCLKTGQPYALEVRYTRLDGTSFLAKVRGRAERDAKGDIIGVLGTLQDMSEREDNDGKLAALAGALPLGAIYRFEAPEGHFTITEVSAGIEALIGLSEKALLADRDVFFEAIAEQDREVLQAEFERALESDGVFDCQFRVIRPDGEAIWLHSRAVPRTRPDGTRVWEAMLWDITVRREATEVLHKAQDAAAARAQAQARLLTTMAHDIRTPMNTIIGMTRLALRTELATSQRGYLDKVDLSAQRLHATLNDVMDFAQIDAGKLKLDHAEFTLELVLDAVSAACAPAADEKRVELAFAIGADVPPSLRGDAHRLSQVLINLVGNAIRCTASGEVVLSIDRVAGDGESPKLEFRVRDTGITLEPKQIAGLFRPFAAAGTMTTPRYGGSGLALAICARLVEQMGGTITVESQIGGHTVFGFAIALQQVGVMEAAPIKPFGSRHVLIVDDNASARTILSDLLSGLGMTPHAVTSGAKALAALKTSQEQSQPYELMLIDWRMPAMDGLELARRVRSDEADRTPVLLMATAHGREEVVRRIEQLGLQGILAKPVTRASILEAMQAVFAAEQDKAKTRLMLTPADQAGEHTMILLADRRILVVDDDALDRQAITDRLELAGMTVDGVASGSEALARLSSLPYDAVLLDMQMPEMDGRETTRRIRRNPAWLQTPVIALTPPAGDSDSGLIPGITARLPKTASEADLYRVLADVFTGTRPVESIMPPDFEAALRRQNGDPARLDRLLRGFIRDFADIPAKLSDLVGTDDMPETAALAHLVKGAAGYLEARQLATIAGELEQAARTGDGNIDALTKGFRRHLLAALDAVGERLAQDEPPVVPAGHDRAATLALIARVRPLAARGDYAATTALKQLANLIEGQTDTQ